MEYRQEIALIIPSDTELANGATEMSYVIE
jgi:hypothetical protein